MKKNIICNICNYDMDKYMLEKGIDSKACDSEDDNNIKLMIPRRRHSSAEKKKADAKWRASFTGKKNGRTREDYKSTKEMNDEKWSFRSYSRGGYDRHGIIQNRRYNEAMEDALEDIVYGKDEIEYDVDQYVRLIDAKDYYENLVNRLQKECDIINFMYSTFSRKMETEGVANNFLYTPTVEIDSYAFGALDEARANLAEVESELDCVRKS